jgi:hypothetical protein
MGLFHVKEKGQPFHRFQSFKRIMEVAIDKRVKLLRTNKLRECSCWENLLHSMKHVCNQDYQLTMPNSPHQNGVVKWKNKIMLEREICLALESNTPTFFWIEIVYITNYFININPSKVNQYIIPKIRKMLLPTM